MVFFLGGEVKRPGSFGHVPLPIQKPGMAVDENQLVHLPEPLLGRDRVHHLHQHQRQVSAPTRAQSRITHNWGASASPPHELPNDLHNPGEVPKSLQLPFPAGRCARHWRTTKCRNCDAFLAVSLCGLTSCQNSAPAVPEMSEICLRMQLLDSWDSPGWGGPIFGNGQSCSLFPWGSSTPLAQEQQGARSCACV